MNPAIRFSPDAFLIAGMKLMGRQAAGTGFLRAAVANRSNEPLWAVSSDRGHAAIFKRLVHEIDPLADARWAPMDRSLDLFPRIGTVYWPAPGLAEPARARLRRGPAAYSLCGVTHTTCSHTVMDEICDMLTAPVMPWDAIICTSAAVAETVTTLLAREADYLRWRFGAPLDVTLPQRRVIPLGVHVEDFAFTEGDRASARQRLNLADDEIVSLFVGRLSAHAKAHPFPAYVGLQRAARRSGKKLVLIQCGWFANPDIEKAFQDGAARFCPDVRVIFVDGQDAERRRDCWAGADIFLSLADNIQETFGLTPIEAMAAGLPAVVTDWNGYKDTVRDGIDGFRITTWMPGPGEGDDFALRYESHTMNYDMYCALTSATVSLDVNMLEERLTSLALRSELRQTMGDAGRRRARELFDWNVVYRQYQALWAELAEIRNEAAKHYGGQHYLRLAPRNAAARCDPYLNFGHYPSKTVLPTTRVSSLQADSADSEDLVRHPLFGVAVHPFFGSSGERRVLDAGIVADILQATRTERQTIQQLANQLRVDVGVTLRAVAAIAKMGLVRLSNRGDVE